MSKKIELSDITSLQAETSALNTLKQNNDKIEAAIQDTLSRSGTSPNAMNANLDMNGYRIFNLPAAITNGEPIRRADWEALLRWLFGQGPAPSLPGSGGTGDTGGGGTTDPVLPPGGGDTWVPPPDGSGAIPIVNETPSSCSINGEVIWNRAEGRLYVCDNGTYVPAQSFFTPDAPVPVGIGSGVPGSCDINGEPYFDTDTGQLFICSGNVYVPIATIFTPDAGAAVGFVDNLPSSCNIEGEAVFDRETNRLYICNEGVFVPAVQAITPDAPTGIAVVSALPVSAEEGEVVFLRTDNKLYKWVSGAWVEVVQAIDVGAEVADASITTAKFAAGIRPVEIVSELPTSGNFSGRIVFLTTDNKLYRHTGSVWTTAQFAGDISGQIQADQIAANSITAGKIAAGAVSTTELAAEAVTASKIAAGTITADRIASNTIDAGRIAANAITSDKIAANAVTAGKIQAGAIGAEQIAASAITAAKIAANAVTAGKIAAGAVSASQIAANAITADKVASNAITAGKIAAGAIGTTQLAAQAITSDKLATNNLITGSAQIANAIVTTLKIGANAVTVPLALDYGTASASGSTFSGSFFMPAAGTVFLALNYVFPDDNNVGGAVRCRTSITIDGDTRTELGAPGSLIAFNHARSVSAGNRTFSISLTREGGGSFPAGQIPRGIVAYLIGAAR